MLRYTVNPAPASEVNFVSVPEAAARIRCSEQHVRNLIAAGCFPVIYDIRTPGSKKPKTRLAREDVDAYIAGAARHVA